MTEDELKNIRATLDLIKRRVQDGKPAAALQEIHYAELWLSDIKPVYTGGGDDSLREMPD